MDHGMEFTIQYILAKGGFTSAIFYWHSSVAAERRPGYSAGEGLCRK